ncbi:hypothetical protein DFH08DRAFT_807275 [Mycena albidolilacea]|uniref:Uncharacterized protein n=1 Tax=Mycena albidolilacea TaxID=1033008 RepID=A0AAD7A5J6_9AGAR|nr:hypothetical protein DFH08DRAFT_807275 [Mycena albidolilacea]
MEVRYGSPDKISPERRQLRSKSGQDLVSASKAWFWESGQGSGGATISNTSPDKVYAGGLGSNNANLHIEQWITDSSITKTGSMVTSKRNVAEVSSAMALKYKELQKKKELVLAVTTLNTVQRHGQPNANIADIEEEGDVDM